MKRFIRDQETLHLIFSPFPIKIVVESNLVTEEEPIF